MRRHRIRYEGRNHARALTFSCYRRLDLLQPDAIKDLFAENLAACRGQQGFQLHAWVVMPNHVHLLLSPGEIPVPRLLRAIKEPIARRVLARWRELGAPILDRTRDARGASHFWQRGGGYDRNVFSPEEVNKLNRYFNENPVRRELVARPEDWAWSSARWYAGDRTGPVPIDPVPW